MSYKEDILDRKRVVFVTELYLKKERNGVISHVKRMTSQAEIEWHDSGWENVLVVS